MATRGDESGSLSADEKKNSDIEEELRHWSEAQSEAKSIRKELTAAEYETRRSADDRSIITLKILDLFRLCLVGTGVLVIANAASRYHFGTAAPEADIAILVDLVKSVLMPIVTLILGYYFGQRKT